MVLIFAIIANGHMMSKFGYYLPWYLLGSIFELVAAALMCKLRCLIIAILYPNADPLRHC